MNQSNPWRRVGLVAALLALLIVLTGAVAEAGKLDRDLKRLRVKSKVAGLSTAIIVGDEIVQAAGYGWANPETRQPVTPETVFALASMSKSLSATIAMRLVDRKLLDLNADVNQYLSFPVINPHFPAQPITLRQLLSHTSSISDQGFYDQIDEMKSTGDWPGSLSQYLIDYLTPGGRFYAPETSFFAEAPGTHGSYSNVGFALVKGLIEVAGGGELDTVSRELLFDPLGMPEASWHLSNLDMNHVAEPCTWTGEEYEAYPHMGLAIGLLRASALELANFARLHLNKGRFEGRRILKRKTARKMAKHHSTIPQGDLGLGFFVIREGEERIAHHRGGAEGMATWLWLDLDEGFGFVMLTNGEPFEHGEQALNAFFKIRDRLEKQGRRLARRKARQKAR